MGATDQMVFQHDYNNSSASSTTIGSESHSSDSSTCSNSLELADDASSSSRSSSSSSVSITMFGKHASMFELSDLMATLPIKRGLSKFYQGRSESFTSLARVMSIEDLAKKEDPYYNNNNRRKMLKASKSYANGFDASSKPYTKNNRNKVSSFLNNITRLRPPLLLPCEENRP